MSIDDERQCLKRSLKRSVSVGVILVAVLAGAAIVIAIVM